MELYSEADPSLWLQLASLFDISLSALCSVINQ